MSEHFRTSANIKNTGKAGLTRTKIGDMRCEAHPDLFAPGDPCKVNNLVGRKGRLFAIPNVRDVRWAV